MNIVTIFQVNGVIHAEHGTPKVEGVIKVIGVDTRYNADSFMMLLERHKLPYTEEGLGELAAMIKNHGLEVIEDHGEVRIPDLIDQLKSVMQKNSDLMAEIHNSKDLDYKILKAENQVLKLKIQKYELMLEPENPSEA